MASTNSKNLATSTNSSDLTTSPNLANLKNSFTLPAFNNPHSAAQRVKNHLAYKLGLAMIAYDTQTGGGFSKLLLIPKLLFTLKNIQKEHKRLHTFYKDLTSFLPELKYPDAHTCPDYVEARLMKFHLAYLLGLALTKTSKNWHKGGLLKLYSEFKKANKFYKNAQKLKALFEEFGLDREVLAGVLEDISKSKNNLLNFDYFTKENLIFFEKVLALAKTHVFKDNDISSETEKIVLENLQEIHSWLNSNEFKEKYLDTNHPYPPLLNPKNLNDKHQKLNYHSIPANSAWEMNLPLPNNYEFIHLANFGSGYVAMTHLYDFCGVKLAHLLEAGDARNTYIQFYHQLNTKGDFFNAIYLDGHNIEVLNQRKLFKLIDKKVPLVSILRDPIERFKPLVNHLTANPEAIWRFNLSFDYTQVLDSVRYYQKDKEGIFDKPVVENVISYGNGYKSPVAAFELYSRTKELDNVSEIIYLDMSEINEQNAFETMKKLASKLGFAPPKESEKKKFEGKFNGGNFLGLIPKVLYVHQSDLKRVFKPKEKEQRDIQSLNLQDGVNIHISVHQKAASHFIDISDELFDGKLPFEDMGLFVESQNDLNKLKRNKKLFESTKAYIKGFVAALQERVKIENEKRITIEQCLDFLKQNKEALRWFKDNFDTELVELKKARPDIVASWKYYAEFEKICETL